MEQLGLAALGALGGAGGYWLITLIYNWWRRPKPQIEFGKGYPYRSETIDHSQNRMVFLNVRIKNVGHRSAQKCKIFVRKIRLNPEENDEIAIPSDFLMQTRWVPREAELWEIDIPRKIEFHANIAFVKDNDQNVQPAFRALNSVAQLFQPHVGLFEVEIVLAGDNFDPVTGRIRFRRTEGAIDLVPLPEVQHHLREWRTIAGWL